MRPLKRPKESSKGSAVDPDKAFKLMDPRAPDNGPKLVDPADPGVLIG